VGIFDRTDELASAGHEQVVFVQDNASGLRAIIAIYSTALGPALGGTRFYPYASEEAAVTDVLKLSRAMAYKNAVAGLPLGGGKAVILGDPATAKTEALLEAYGTAVDRLGGRYYTACDVGTFVPDMDVIHRRTRFVTGRSPGQGGAGDSALLTAYGVFQALRAAAEHTWGSPSLAGRRVGVEGVGKVGRRLVAHLQEDGAEVVVSDTEPGALTSVDAASLPVAELRAANLDVYAPCALGGSLTDEVVAGLRARIVCGAANNQLAHPGVEGQLFAREILYVPDYVANAGGVVQVADEIQGFDLERATARAARIHETVLTVLSTAAVDGVPPAVAADRIAEQRMAAARS
jgi:valine dehydrogenase (NAD+)